MSEGTDRLSKEVIPAALCRLDDQLCEKGVTGELFPIPVWAEGTSRALLKPWFAAKTHNLRMILLQESPTAFRLRNIFVSANALSRA